MAIIAFIFSGILTTIWIFFHIHQIHDLNKSELNFTKSEYFNFICGIRNLEPTSRIINGFSARDHSWPWIVSLRKYNNFFNTLSGHYCGGIIISNQIILTAAHCVYGYKVEEIAVIVGINQKDERVNLSNIFHVKEAVYHRNFISSTLANDIALIRLKRNINFTKIISPICLPPSWLNLTVVQDKILTLIGWGSVDGTDRQTSLPENLQETNLKIINGEYVCSSFVNYDSSKIFCAIDPNLDISSNACFGDSGGPLMYEINGTWHVLGITSFIISNTRGNCNPKVPSYYTQVNYYLDWINETLSKF